MTHSELLIKSREYTKYSYVELGARINASKQLINWWKKTNNVPEEYWPKIQKATENGIKASWFKKRK